MLEDSQEIQEIETLKQRQKQKNLFGLDKSTTQTGFKIINSRKEESIIEKFDENAKECDYENKQDNQNINTSISKNYSFMNKSVMKISEKEELNKDQFNDSLANGENGTFQKERVEEGSLNNSLLNENYDNSPQLRKEIQNVSSQEPHFQLVMKIKKQINLYFQKFTFIGKKVNLENKIVRNLVNDLSDFYEVHSDYSFSTVRTQISMLIKRILTKYKLNNLKVLSLQDNYVLFFKIITTLTSYVYLFFLSIILIFNLRYESDHSQSLVQNYMTVQWIVEIILKLNCASSQETEFIEQRSEIFSIYMKKYFAFDIIPIIFMHLQFEDSYSWQFYFVKSFIFLKFYTTECDLKDIQKQLVIISRKHYIIQIINLNLNLFFVGHIIACMWQIVGIIDSTYLDNENSWVITNYEFNAGQWWKVYIQAFYWSFTLMATGSNIAASVCEMYFTSLVMPFTTIIFGYMINTIGIILSEIDQQEEFRRKDINIINRYMDRKNISKDLQTRVNLDLEYFYQKNFKKIQEDEEGVLSKISEQLYKSLQYEYNMGIFKKMKNLSNNFSLDTLTELCYTAQEITYSPNQTIFTENQTTDSCLMYIISGKVQISQQVLQKTVLQNDDMASDDELPLQQDKDKYTSRILGYLKEGQTFGELNFFTGLGRAATIKSSSFTRILKISRDQFMEIVKNNNKDLERYCEIRDKISLYSDYSDLKFCCSICQKSDHLNNFCPNAHFNKKSPFIFARINHSNQQSREKEFKRKRAYYRQFFQKLENVNAQAKEAQVQFISDDEDEEDLNQEYYDQDESQYSDNIQSQRSIAASQKLQSLVAEKPVIHEKPEAIMNDMDKPKSSFLMVADPNKQEELLKRNSYFQKEDIQQSQSRIEQYLEPKKRNTKLSLIQQEDYTKRPSYLQSKEKEEAHPNAKGEVLSQDQSQSRKKYYQNNLSFLNPDERRNTFHQQLYNNNTMQSNFSIQKNKVDISYMHYNKSDEIIKDILLWNFDKMKHFNYYFASGNFKFIINKYQMIRKRQISTKFLKEKSPNNNNVRLSKKQTSKKAIFY